VMPNTAEWPIILLGAMEAGLLVSTANPHFTTGIFTDTTSSTVGRHGKLLLGERTSREVGTQVSSMTSRNRGSAN